MAKSSYSKAGKAYVEKKVKVLRKEGKSAAQAKAVALEMARDRGLKVPKKKG